jgi:hypothetical protein
VQHLLELLDLPKDPGDVPEAVEERVSELPTQLTAVIGADGDRFATYLDEDTVLGFCIKNSPRVDLCAKLRAYVDVYTACR